MDEKHSDINPNTSWIYYKGSWITNAIVVAGLKILFSVIPGISYETSWTLTTVTYNLLSFIMFHAMTGVPFEYNQGEFEDLTLWEQLDGGAEFTPAKKYLTAVPIILFLTACHYSHFDLPTFLINLASLMLVLVAKMKMPKTPPKPTHVRRRSRSKSNVSVHQQ